MTHPLWGDATLRLGADGDAPAGPMPSDGCCVHMERRSACDLACSFVELLPSGPMWDRPKYEALRLLREQTVCDPPCRPDRACITMVDYAIYVAHVLADMLDRFVWLPELERRPETAMHSLDDWLDLYGWRDCHDRQCGAVDGLPEEWTEPDDCGDRSFCAPVLSDAQETALKRAIAVALMRASRGGIRNLGNLNWVIRPLGARIEPVQPWPQPVQDWLGNPVGDPPCFCDVARLRIVPEVGFIPVVPPEAGNVATVPASANVLCNGNDVSVYPGLAAAFCIVTPLLRAQCPVIVEVEV